MAFNGGSEYTQFQNPNLEIAGYTQDLNDPILNYQIGYVYMQLDIYDLALKSLQTYIVEYPNDYLGYYLIG